MFESKNLLTSPVCIFFQRVFSFVQVLQPVRDKFTKNEHLHVTFFYFWFQSLN